MTPPVIEPHRRTTRTPAPYGTWPSPITADLIASSAIRLGAICADGGDVLWVEGRATEGGRSVIVRRSPDGTVTDVTPAPFSARTRANEYGGGAVLARDGVVYFTNDGDGRVYAIGAAGAPRALTPEGAYQYADLDLDAARDRLVGVREDRTTSSDSPTNTIVGIALDGSTSVEVLIEGDDFYSNPRLSPGGDRMSWLSWNQPDMPWDTSMLWVSPVDPDGMPRRPLVRAGAPGVSVFQPLWSAAGELHFVDDRTGWWNLYKLGNDGGEAVATTSNTAESGLPQWNFGMTVYALHADGDIVHAVCDRGEWSLVHLRADGTVHPLALPFTEFGASIQFTDDAIVAILASPTHPASVVRVELPDCAWTALQSASAVSVGSEWFSLPERIEFPTAGDVTAHAFYYPPHNPDATGTAGATPPLIIQSHGGPTSAASTELDLTFQYWTSRGFAVVDVNYGGSTGFGRAYRERLDGMWGIVDVHDCINAAKFLVARGDVNPSQLAIAGGSAGGFTTLAALTFHDDLSAGVSSYGVGDLAALAEHTHKFEARYLDRLVAPWPSGRAVYDQRSPVHHADQLSCPILLLQGLEDRVVPPAQAEQMLATMRARGIPCAYVAFEGEQHGWRRAATIKRALEAELSFYAQVFGFTPVDDIEPVTVENLRAEPTV